MRRIGSLLSMLLLATACSAGGESSRPHLGSAALERVEIDLSHHFDALEAEGAFLLVDHAAGRMLVHDPERAARRFLPASTFKILNSLIALEEGVVRDENEVIAWDGADRGNPDWNRDHSMTTGFQASAVWFYQELARRTGDERMAEWVRRAGYGNADTGGGIDRFWLTGDLRISPEEQIHFLRRLHAGDLPFSARSMDAVRRLLRMDRIDGVTLSGKTGWARLDGRHYGWLVGWVERGGDPYFYATQIESGRQEFPMRRAQQQITRGILRELDLIP